MLTLDINSVIEAIPFIQKGILITLFISALSSAFAFIIGVAISFFRNTGNFALRQICAGYVEITRNTPILIHLYIYYKALPSIGIHLSPIACGIIALSFYTGVYISEVLRAGIMSIPSEQYEAARGLGLNKLQTFFLIIFPQAIRIVIPPLGSQFINLIKNSSIVSFISVTDIFYVVYKQAVDDFRFFEFFIIGASIYITLTGLVALLTNLLEKKYSLQKETAGA